jgi:tRNA nucleotidyltransferase/poly(A) polymerase
MWLNEITSDIAKRRIDMTPLKRHITPNLKMLLNLMELYGFKLRIVGGAVRDILMGTEPRDIDLITDALPDQVMYILQKHKIPYITKGIPHGTVKLKFINNEEYEITSLGFEIEDECCPPSIVVHSGTSWKGDANRRDFTIDSMSIDFDGHLYDYLNGISDLRNQYIKFIGSPSERIEKDPILIIRFFKLLSKFKNPKYDASIIPILKEKVKLIKKIKPERIAKEMNNIKSGINAERVLKMMKNLGYDKVINQLE